MTTEATSRGATAASTLRQQFLEARRAEILDAARRVFVDHGCDAASMQQIARAAGVSAGNIYRYFPNKEALILAVCEDCEQQDRESFAAVQAENASPLDALYAAGDKAFAQFAHDDARQATMLTLESALVAARNGEFGPAVHNYIAGLRDAIAQLVASAQDSGELDSSIDSRAMGELLLAVVGGLRLMQLQLEGDVDADGVWTLLQRIVRAFGTEGVASDVDAAR